MGPGITLTSIHSTPSMAIFLACFSEDPCFEKMPVILSLQWLVYNVAANSALVVSFSYWTFLVAVDDSGKYCYIQKYPCKGLHTQKAGGQRVRTRHNKNNEFMLRTFRQRALSVCRGPSLCVNSVIASENKKQLDNSDFLTQFD